MIEKFCVFYSIRCVFGKLYVNGNFEIILSVLGDVIILNKVFGGLFYKVKSCYFMSYFYGLKVCVLGFFKVSIGMMCLRY